MERYFFFYRGIFSQWHYSPFIENGIEFRCAEQYMMYKKAQLFNDTKIMNMILGAEHPSEHKHLGRQILSFNQDIWDSNKISIVYRGNYLKFSQNKDLYYELMKTKGMILAEASQYDCIWGIGIKENDPRRFNYSEWRGENLLGNILTYLREFFIMFPIYK